MVESTFVGQPSVEALLVFVARASVAVLERLQPLVELLNERVAHVDDGAVV
jgi:hypothetical protein